MNPCVALVTGAGRGIGRGIAVALAERGWNVVINFRGNAEAAQSTLHNVEQSGGRAVLIQADISSATDRERLIDATVRHFGRIDVLVNNAGMAPRQRVDLLEVSEASYDEVMAVNLKGPFFLTQRAAKEMLKLIQAQTIPRGMIINIGSISAYTSSINRAEYCISKAGMAMMTQLYADRLAEHNINVYEIRPGIIETDMTSVAKAKYDKLIAEGLTPIRRWGTPEDVGRAVVAIVEGAFPMSTGEIINVDGGFHLRRL
ncbi:MAG: 3-ketoacyl-ACP reductase [Anaerolineae bacterium]|nr:3-ketoacyl-ACP reductase [Thermoflexales bacterium]MDW8408372.1 3-ketoacyl-ACP reductase [Anaerolineae bacterium]